MADDDKDVLVPGTNLPKTTVPQKRGFLQRLLAISNRMTIQAQTKERQALTDLNKAGTELSKAMVEGERQLARHNHIDKIVASDVAEIESEYIESAVSLREKMYDADIRMKKLDIAEKSGIAEEQAMNEIDEIRWQIEEDRKRRGQSTSDTAYNTETALEAATAHYQAGLRAAEAIDDEEDRAIEVARVKDVHRDTLAKIKAKALED